MVQGINGRENLLRVFRHEPPLRIPRNEDTCFFSFSGDWSSDPQEGHDLWGAYWKVMPLAGQMVDETKPPILTDLTQWQQQVKVPDPAQFDWQGLAAGVNARWNRETQMGACILLEGHFERLHSLMGFEEALISLYEEDAPEHIKALFAEITQYKFACLRLAKQHLNPDVIVYHDDWGTDVNLFFHPDFWRELVKPELKRVVDECHRLGMYFEMHSCGHIQELVGDLVELGIDSIQTLQYPQNDIEMVKGNWGERLVIRGGYDGQLIMNPKSTEEDIRASVCHSLEVLAPGGNHIPYYYSFGTDAAGPMAIFNDEIDRYEAQTKA